MGADKALHCDCGLEVRGSDELLLVAAIRRHALEAHDMDLPVALARDLARGARPVADERGRDGADRKDLT